MSRRGAALLAVRVPVATASEDDSPSASPSRPEATSSATSERRSDVAASEGRAGGQSLRAPREKDGASLDGSREKRGFEFKEVSAIGRRVIEVANELRRAGLTSAEVCSLFTHAASALAVQDDGLEPGEWLELCAELEGGDVPGSVPDPVLTAPGGQC